MPPKQRWPGGSSASNPTIRKHREKALEKFQTGGKLNAIANTHHQKPQQARTAPGQSKLTVDALSAHNAKMQEQDEPETLDELLTTSDDPFASVRSKMNSTNISHKEECAVLAAITETVKATDANPSDVAYWAALMSAIGAIKSSKEIASATAIVHLLSLVFPRVPPAVVKARFSSIIALLVDTLKLFSDAPSNQNIVKHSLACISTALTSLDPAAWAEQESLQTVRLFMRFSVDARPKVRRLAQQRITSLIESLHAEVATHPAIAAVFQVALQSLKEGSADNNATLHIMMLLRSILPFASPANVKSICNELQRILKANNAIASMLVLSIFRGLFESSQVENLPANVLEVILATLLDQPPALGDSSARCGWNSALARGYVRLAGLKKTTALAALPRFVTLLLDSLSEQDSDMPRNVLDNITLLIENCLPSNNEELQALKSTSASVQNIVNILGSGLRFRFQHNHPSIMKFLAAMFIKLGSLGPALAKEYLLSLIELHETEGYKYVGDVELAIGAAIRGMGPEVFLTIVPLDLESEELKTDFPKAWLLPLMQRNIKNANIEYFTRAMVPLAAYLLKKAEDAKAANNAPVSKLYHTLHTQVWNLLPSFFDSPVDVQSSFKGIARLLGDGLTTRPDLRANICRALKTGIKTISAADAGAMASFARNYLPILFNLYSTCREDEKGLIIETIEAYVSITDAALLGTFFRNIIKRLLEAGNAEGASDEAKAKSQHEMMDLAYTMVSQMDAESLNLFYRVLKPQLQHEDVTLQKKSYRALLAICSCTSPVHIAFVHANLEELKENLVGSLLTATPASKAYRLKCLSFIVQNIPSSELLQFVTSVIGEALLCTKEVKEKAREAAFELLEKIGDKALANDGVAIGESKNLTVDAFVTIIAAGLAGKTAHMMSAATLALAKVVYQHRTKISADVRKQVNDTVLVLLGSKQREVVKSVFGYIKVLFSITPNDELREYLPVLATSLVTWPDDMQRHFKLNARYVFERLIRKFGVDDVLAATPEEHHKLIANIRKVTERQKRDKAKAKEENEEDGNDEDADRRTHRMQSFEDVLNDGEDEEDEEGGDDDGAKSRMSRKSGATSRSKVSRANDVWLKNNEDGDDDMLDFLDSSATRKIRTQNPNAPAKAQKENPFKTHKDGRFVIRDLDGDSDDSDDNQDAKSTKSKSSRKPHPDAMELDDGGITLGRGIHRDRDRKRGRSMDDDDDDEESDDVNMFDSRSMKSKGTARTTATAKSGMSTKSGVSTKSGATARTSATSRTSKTTATQKTQRSVPGSEFRSKRAGGDVQRKGMPQPYAYLPLDNAKLNKRKRAKASDDFRSIISAAKDGSKRARASQKGHRH